MPQTTGRTRDLKDQFYTTPDVARQCVERLRTHVSVPTHKWIEPSAGTGSFLQYVPDATGYDIDPKHSSIHKADFLTLSLPDGCVLFGNPPFGRQGSTARAFIAHGASAAAAIGFILPRSFVKPSMNRAFPPCFHLVDSWDIPEQAFLVNGSPYSVPCIWQIWVRKETPRHVLPQTPPNGFAFVTHTEPYTLAFRRVGGTAGTCSRPNAQCRQSHYFIRLDRPDLADWIIDQSKIHPFPTNTTGPRSLSKQEATEFLNACIARAPR